MGECCHDKEEMDMSHQMMQLADWAWSDLMKEKMKKAFEKERGTKMDKVAAISVKASIDCWTKKMQGKESDQKYFEELGKKLDSAMKG